MLVATGAALLLSLGVETLQRFMISRYSSLLDVLANGGGAALGALAVTRWRRAG